MVSAKYLWEVHEGGRTVPAGAEALVAHLLTLRGMNGDGARNSTVPAYEDALHDASLLPDFDDAIQRLLAAKASEETVVVYGDYDVDGVTSSVLLHETFQTLGMRSSVVLPHREKDGYGLTVDAVRACVPPATLLVAVDNGTSAHDAIREARTRGADVIVIDHHTVPAELPDALVVNPARSDSRYPFPKLSAVGLAYQFARTLFSRARRDGQEKWLLDLVALGTLADRVPLQSENRALVHFGLRVMRENRRLGLAALLAQARVSPSACSADAVSFRLVPRLNAAGRMQHADLAFQLLTADDPTLARELAEQLETMNTERRKITERITAEISERLLRTVPLPDVVAVSGPWPVGVLGILAGRIAEDLGRPTVAISVGAEECVASVRGNGTVHVVDMLQQLAPVLTRFGGHAEAAGLSFPRSALGEVEAFFARYALRESAAPQRTLTIDAMLSPELVRTDLVRALQVLEPHGEGNARPVFLLPGVEVLDARAIGAGGAHRRFTFRGEAAEPLLPAVAFRWGGRDGPAPGHRVDLAIELHLDRYGRRERVDLHIRDMRSAETTEARALGHAVASTFA